MQDPYIIYNLPKDRFTQKFKKTKIPEILDLIKEFLVECTTTNFNSPSKLLLTAFTAYDVSEESNLLNEIISKTLNVFGQVDGEPVSFHYPSGIASYNKQFNWDLTSDRLIEVIDYLINSSPMPKTSLGPLRLFIAYDFKLINVFNKTELPNQFYNSSICIYLDRGRAVAPSLFFPFDMPNVPFWNYLDQIKPLLPFELEEKYLRLAKVNINGEIKSFKKFNRLI